MEVSENCGAEKDTLDECGKDAFVKANTTPGYKYN